MNQADEAVRAKSWKELVDFIGDRFDLDVRIDEPAFARVDRPRFGEMKSRWRSWAGNSLGVALTVNLDRVGATYEVHGRAVWIIPADPAKCLAERLPLAQKSLRDRLKSPVAVAEPIKPDTPLAEALKVLQDRYEVPILIDQRAFDRAGIKGIDQRPVRLVAQPHTSLRALLQQLLNPLGATFVPRDNLVLVIPLSTASSHP